MSRSLIVHVHLHDGRYHGIPDWPPSPSRLFQALVAGAARGSQLAEVDVAALEWLERLRPPVIAAPSAREGKGYSNYVPNNDLDAKGGDPARIAEVRAEKIIRPRFFDGGIPLHYVWSIEDRAEEDQLAGRICELADQLYQLGRGIDMAWAWGEVQPTSEADRSLATYAGCIHRPCESGVGHMLACPEIGSMHSLIERYSAQRQRFTTSTAGRKVQRVFSQPPKARFTRVSYDCPAEFKAYDVIGTKIPSPLERAAELVTLIRDMAAKRLVEACPDKKLAIERHLIGRGAAESDKAARVRILPLPSIGHQHADRRIRRLLVEIPPACPIGSEDLAWAFSGLTQADEATGEIDLGLIATTDFKMAKHYGISRQRGANRWQTVTAAVLPESAARRRIDPQRVKEEFKGATERTLESGRAVGAVLQALRHVGIGSRVTSVAVQREPFDAKGTRAEEFAGGTRFRKERLWHVQIDFADRVTGPLVIGDGRYLGLGLMAPMHVDSKIDGLRCFRIVSGLSGSSDPEECARALRRAVMARVQQAMGQRSLPTFFTGHEPDGAPARNGTHAHLAFIADLDRSRLLIVAPHMLARQLPGRSEHRYLRLLDEAMGDFVELRAGSSGRLQLVPALVDAASDPLLAPARQWVSVTEYRPTRHAKRTSPAEGLGKDVRMELERLGISDPKTVDVFKVRKGSRGELYGRVKLEFAHSVSGLLLIGRTRHSGGGLLTGVG